MLINRLGDADPLLMDDCYQLITSSSTRVGMKVYFDRSIY